MARTILNAGLLGILREVVDRVCAKHGEEKRRKPWIDLLKRCELNCIGREKIPEIELLIIEDYILQEAKKLGIRIRGMGDGRSKPMAGLAKTGPLQTAP